MPVGRLPIVNWQRAASALHSRLPARMEKEVFAFYSSALGGISTDPSLASVPLDDHGFHRGHAVFDTCNVSDGKAFGLDFHLDRLLRSAAAARIASPPDKEDLRSIVLQTIAATRRADGVFVRYWLTAGRGNFEVSPRRCAVPYGFYAVAHADGHTTDGPRGVTAAVVDVPLKPALLATIKSNNYMLNAFVAMEVACRRLGGGRRGGQVEGSIGGRGGWGVEGGRQTLARTDAP
jgi:4-amino-4-deoxychorismate lyase